MRSVSLRLHYVRAMGQKRLAGIIDLLDFGLDTTVTGVQKSGMESLPNEVLRREPHASMSEDISSGTIPVFVLVEQRSLNALGKSGTSAHSFGYHHMDKQTLRCYFLHLQYGLLVSLSFHTKTEFLAICVFCCRSPRTDRFVLHRLMLRMKGI